jgi:hypothetical protein
VAYPSLTTGGGGGCLVSGLFLDYFLMFVVVTEL